MAVFLAWLVHLYTALGGVIAGVVAVLICAGDERSLIWCFGLLTVATVVDCSDGALARAARVKQVLPGFDGRRLDDLVDFLTYAFLPLLLLHRAGIPSGAPWVLALPLLAALYGFCQTDIKTDDGYFLGFPSYWNVLAFYLFALRPLPPWLEAGSLLGFALLTFVPTRYLYPSQPGLINRVTIALGAPWGALVLWILQDALRHGRFDARLVLLSLYFPAFYNLASFWITLRRWRRGR